MNLSEQLKALNEFDLADLDMENIGSWPLVLKGIVLVLLYVVILSPVSTCMWMTSTFS